MQAEGAYLSALTAVEGFKEAEGQGTTTKQELLQFLEEVGELLYSILCTCLKMLESFC